MRLCESLLIWINGVSAIYGLANYAWVHGIQLASTIDWQFVVVSGRLSGIPWLLANALLLCLTVASIPIFTQHDGAFLHVFLHSSN